jgi:hypothetical protein
LAPEAAVFSFSGATMTKAEAAANARAAMAAKRAAGQATYKRKKKARVELRTTFTMAEDGALFITDGAHNWPLNAEETTRLRAFLNRCSTVEEGARDAG